MNLNVRGINSSTVSISDYKLVAKNLAKVVIAYTGKQSPKEISASLSAQLKQLAAPVESSFRIVRAGVAVGFIRATREVRPVEEQELRAGYRVMSSNIMMDEKDKTLWEIKKSGGNMYLARQGNEDLSELVSASVNPRSDTPRLRQLTMATAAPREFVAFATDTGDMDYGFVVAASREGDKIKVVSHTTNLPTVVSTEVVAGVYNIPISRAAHQHIVSAGINRDDVNQSIDYYKRLYGYDQAYLNEVIKDIEETAAM